MELWDKFRSPGYDGPRTARLIAEANIEFVDRNTAYHGGDINKLLANNSQPASY